MDTRTGLDIADLVPAGDTIIMITNHQVHHADEQRRRAMIEADADGLERLLGDDLHWTHSSGQSQDKAAFIHDIVEGHVRYLELAIEQDQLLVFSDVAVHRGTLHGQATRNGQPKTLSARFLSVWRAAADGETLQLIAWQSTNIT